MFGYASFADNVEDATVYYNEAIDLYSQDQVNKSVELFKKAIDLNPDFYEAYYNLSQILMSLEKDEEAYNALQQILRLKPNDSETLYNLGKIQYKRGYLSNAYEYLNRISTSAPQYESAKIIINKIEKRQGELSLERKIGEHRVMYNDQNKALGDVLAEIKAPSGIAIDSRDNIYVASFGENVVYKVSVYGKKSVFSNSSFIKGPIGIAIDKDDNVYVANYISNSIVKIQPSGAASIYASIAKPYCISYDSTHNRLYVTEQNSNKLVKFDL